MNDGKILVVDDNEDDIFLTLRALKKNSIANEVIVAHDGQEALDILLAENESERMRPALILLDLNMPRIGGLEVLKRIKSDERTRKIPTVILTTSTEEDDKIKGYDNGANSFIRKPVDFDEFTKTVEQLGIYWLMINQGVKNKNEEK